MNVNWHCIKSRQDGWVWLVTAIPIVRGTNAFFLPREVALAAVDGFRARQTEEPQKAEEGEVEVDQFL